MKKILVPASIMILLACSNKPSNETKEETAGKASAASTDLGSKKHFRGAIENGMKGDSLFFDVSADGKKLENLTFKGYWRCSGKLEQETAAGPQGSYDIVKGRANGHISEPPNGGASAWRFDIDATIEGKSAKGTFRMNINGLGCDSYLLKFTATAL